MSNWEPSIDFESEILSLQPDCDITPEYYKPPSLAGNFFKAIALSRKDQNTLDYEEHQTPDIGEKIKMINYATPHKPVGKRVVPNEDSDEEGNYSKEQEIVTMMRNAGIGPHVEGFDRKKTIATIDPKEPYIFSKKHSMPIFLDKSYFKFPTDPLSEVANKKSVQSNGTSGSTSTTSSSSFHQFKTLYPDSDDNENDKNNAINEISYEKFQNDNSSDEKNEKTKKRESHFKSHKIEYYTPQEIYKMKRGTKNTSVKCSIYNTKKLKKT